jgi:hypothetical protein
MSLSIRDGKKYFNWHNGLTYGDILSRSCRICYIQVIFWSRVRPRYLRLFQLVHPKIIVIDAETYFVDIEGKRIEDATLRDAYDHWYCTHCFLFRLFQHYLVVGGVERFL